MARKWTATGRRLENVAEVRFFDFEAGRIAEAWGLEGTVECMRRLGLTDLRTARYRYAVGRCCDPRGCDEFFGASFAGRVAKRYRKRGLDRTSRRIVAFLERAGVQQATVLEIGGGVGEIQLELLKRGAASAVNLELSPAYDAEARRLLREAGFDEARVQRRLHDIAADPEG